MLIERGRLIGAFRAPINQLQTDRILRISKFSAEYGTDIPYAIKHQKISGRFPYTRVPRRQFLQDPGAGEIDSMGIIMEDFITDLINRMVRRHGEDKMVIITLPGGGGRTR